MIGTSYGRGRVLRALSSTFTNPRTGLERWVSSNTVASADRNGARPTHLEIHHDVSVVLSINASWQVAHEASDEATLVATPLIESAALEFVALASLVANQLAPSSELLLRGTITVAATNRHQFAAIDFQSNKAIERAWSRRSSVIEPVLTALLPDPDVIGLRTVGYELASGLLNQFGLESELARPVDSR
jgi:hypothetical protein